MSDKPTYAELETKIKDLEKQINKNNQLIEILNESKEKFRIIFEHANDEIIYVSVDGTIIEVNNKVEDILGYKPDDIIGKNFNALEFIDEESFKKVSNVFQDITMGKHVPQFEFETVSEDRKTRRIVEVNANAVRKNDEICGILNIIRDITDRKILEDELVKSMKHVKEAESVAIIGLAKLAEYRDQDTGEHLERIREYVKVITTAIKNKPKYKSYITDDYIFDIYQSSVLHDIGKVSTPDSILLKPGKLTEDEFEVMKLHTIVGGDALKAADAQIKGQSFLTLGREIAYFHHEKWNGSGYPQGLEKNNIPLSARIVAIADVYDALTSKRPYKEAFSHEKAVSIISKDKGTHFDPDIVDSFLLHQEKFNEIRGAASRDH